MRRFSSLEAWVIKIDNNLPHAQRLAPDMIVITADMVDRQKRKTKRAGKEKKKAS
jgi:predicted MPP superfamily phosphohydrolase